MHFEGSCCVTYFSSSPPPHGGVAVLYGGHHTSISRDGLYYCTHCQLGASTPLKSEIPTYLDVPSVGCITSPGPSGFFQI